MIGVRKGLPNFNEFAMEMAIGASRKLEFIRANTNVPPHITNQLYMVGVSNFFAVEAWNSHTQNFFAPVTILTSNSATLTFTNSEKGVLFGGPKQYVLATTTNVAANAWSNYPLHQVDDPHYTNSFILPLRTNLFFVPNSALRLPAYTLEPLTANPTYDPITPSCYAPDLQLVISNRLTFLMSVSNRIIDYLAFDTTNALNVSSTLAGETNRPLTLDTSPQQALGACWSTNRSAPNAPTEGVQAQISIALGRYPLYDPFWRSVGPDYAPPSNYGDREETVHSFKEFMFPDPWTTNRSLRQIAPFIASRRILYSAAFEVNDPLVQDMVEHLIGREKPWDVRVFEPGYAALPQFSLWDLNRRYSPWKGNPKRQHYDSAYDFTLKDPQPIASRDRQFASGNNVTLRWLDQIHRGTPWQTLYLDGFVANTHLWREHFPDPSLLAHPTNDWRIVQFIRDTLHETGPLQSPFVLNNTIVVNESSGKGAGLYVVTNASLNFANNIVAANSSGIFSEPGTSLNLPHNCVAGNGSADYEGAQPGIGAIPSSPQFSSVTKGDFSLVATSPLIDAGHEDALLWIERAGPTQVYGQRLDIGAHEFGPTGTPVITETKVASAERELELTGRGFPDQPYVIDASQDLRTWISISTNIAQLGQISFRDSINFPHRFYRVKRHSP